MVFNREHLLKIPQTRIFPFSEQDVCVELIEIW